MNDIETAIQQAFKDACVDTDQPSVNTKAEDYQSPVGEILGGLYGSVFHLMWIDHEMIDNRYIISAIARGIARELQYVRCSSERRLDRWRNEAKDNMDDMIRDGERVDMNIGELQGLSVERLERFMETESQIELLKAVERDLHRWFDDNNDYAPRRKFLPKTDDEIKASQALWEVRSDTNRKAHDAAMEFMAKQRELNAAKAEAVQAYEQRQQTQES